MKSNPFSKVLAPLLKCKKCKDQLADPKTGLCKECEIEEMIR